MKVPRHTNARPTGKRELAEAKADALARARAKYGDKVERVGLYGNVWYADVTVNSKLTKSGVRID